MSFHFNLKNSLHHFLHNKSSGNELPFDFCLSGKVFISTLFLMDRFAGYSIFGSQLFFSTLNIRCHTLSLGLQDFFWEIHWQIYAGIWGVPSWTEKPGRLQSMGSHRVGHDWSDLAVAAACMWWVPFLLLFSNSLFFFDFWHFDYNVSSEVLDVHPNLCFFGHHGSGCSLLSPDLGSFLLFL